MNDKRRKEINESRADTLLPEIKEEILKVLGCVEEDGWAPMITEAYRSPEIQTAYYAQGREDLDETNRLRDIAGLDPIEAEENKHIITYATAGKSYHQSRRAVDLVQYKENEQPDWDNMNFYECIWNYLKPLGYKWGENFSEGRKDRPHFEK